MPDAAELRRHVDALVWYQGLPQVRTPAVCSASLHIPVASGNRQVLRALHGLPPLGSQRQRIDALTLPRRDQPRLKSQRQPRALEARYRAQLLKRVRQTNELLMRALRSRLKALAPAINKRAEKRGDSHLDAVVAMLAHRADTVESDIAALLRVIDQVERAVGAPTAAQVEGVGSDVEGFTTRAVNEQLRTVPAIDLVSTPGVTSDLLDAWVGDNVDLISSIDKKFFDEVRDAVRLTLEEGFTTETLARSLQERFEVSKSKARLIARDQVGTLNAKVTEARQTSLGIEEYIWDNIGDPKVRKAHQDAPTGLGGTTQRWDRAPPEGPGHPGEPINCILPGQEVRGSFVAGVRSWYAGEIVELKTASGRRLRLTVNHPVPTTRGWVVAQKLRHGDEVFRYRGDIDSGVLERDDPADRPAAIEQVFAALALICGVRRRDVTALDLHGDATRVQGQIDVAAPTRLLLGQVDASGPQLGRKLAFPFPDMGEVLHAGLRALDLLGVGMLPAADGLPCSGTLALDGLGPLGADLFPLHDFGSGASADIRARLDQLRADPRASQAETIGQRLDGFAPLVSRDQFCDGRHPARHLHALLFGSTPDLDAPLRHMASEGRSLDSDLTAQRMGALTSAVAGDEIVEIRNDFFTGHVYDLQSTTGIMVAEGLCISNCRCTALPSF